MAMTGQGERNAHLATNDRLAQANQGEYQGDDGCGVIAVGVSLLIGALGLVVLAVIFIR